MMQHQPGDGLGLLGRETDARAELARDLGAELGMVAAAALGDVVQQERHVERAPRLHLVDHLGRERMILAELAVLDAMQDAEREQRVLVDRVHVIHVELHLRHDTAEVRHEAAEDADLVHAPEDALGIAGRGQRLEEEAVGFGIGAELPVDQVEMTRRQLQRTRMDVEGVRLRHVEQAQQRHRILGEGVVRGHRQPLALQHEAVEIAAAERERGQAEARRPLVLALDRRTQDARQVADVLGDQVVVLHEALDAAGAGVIAIAHAAADLALHVEGQALLRALRDEVQVKAERPQKVMRLGEGPGLGLGDHALQHQLLDAIDAIDVLGDPEKRVQVAQAALAVLDVGLDHVARVAELLVALLHLVELGLDEFLRGAGDDLLLEAAPEILVQLLLAPDVARLHQRGADRHVRLRLADALLDRAHRMPDLESQVPEHVEDRLDDLLGPGRALVGEQEQQVDVGERRQLAAAVAADRDQRQALALGRVRDREQRRLGGVEEDADHLVHQVGGCRSAGRTALLGVEAPGDLGAALGQRLLQHLDDRRPVELAAVGQGVELGRQLPPVDDPARLDQALAAAKA